MSNPEEHNPSDPLDRRQFLKLLGATGLAALLAGCQPQTPSESPSPTLFRPAVSPFTATASPSTSATATATAAATAAATPAATPTPVQPPPPAVAIEKVNTYDRAMLRAALEHMLDGVGGLRDVVKPGARVGIKTNLTGTWWQSPESPPAAELFITHPAVVEALGELLLDAGAGHLYILDGLGDPDNFDKWGYTEVAQRLGAQLVDLCMPDPYPDFVRMPVKPNPFIYDAFLLNGILGELDVLASVAKLKVHSIGGVTLALKNMFGIAPISKYRQRAADNNRSEFHQSWIYDPRFSRIIIDLCQVRPIHLAVIDGIFSAEGGAGPWDPGLSQVKPGLLLAGKDPVATDAVATAVMDFDPQAADRTSPFLHCDNYLALANQVGLGTHELDKIDVIGKSIEQVKFPFKPVSYN